MDKIKIYNFLWSFFNKLDELKHFSRINSKELYDLVFAFLLFNYYNNEFVIYRDILIQQEITNWDYPAFFKSNGVKYVSKEFRQISFSHAREKDITVLAINNFFREFSTINQINFSINVFCHSYDTHYFQNFFKFVSDFVTSISTTETRDVYLKAFKETLRFVKDKKIDLSPNVFDIITKTINEDNLNIISE